MSLNKSTFNILHYGMYIKPFTNKCAWKAVTQLSTGCAHSLAEALDPLQDKDITHKDLF